MSAISLRGQGFLGLTGGAARITVQEQLGHANVVTTMVYTRELNKRREKIIKKG